MDWFLAFSAFQTAVPDCTGHSRLPVMASLRQPLGIWSGWHTPAGLAVSVSVPHAGGCGQRSCETTWNKVWTQPQGQDKML